MKKNTVFDKKRLAELAGQLLEGYQLHFIDEVDNKEYLAGLLEAMYEELPSPKPKKKK